MSMTRMLELKRVKTSLLYTSGVWGWGIFIQRLFALLLPLTYVLSVRFLTIPPQFAGEKDDGLWQGTTGHSSSRDHSNHNHNHRWTTGSILRWSPIPILSALVYASYKRLQEVEDEIKTNGVKELEVTAYRLLPWRTISRAWGWANSIPLPVWARKPFLSW